MTIQEVTVFWQKAGIPTRRSDHCIEKLLKVYDQWKGLQKHLNRTGGKNIQKKDAFVGMMDDLFDIAHSEVLEKIKNEEDKKYLLLQRQKGRPGAMLGVDKNQSLKEHRALKRASMEAMRKKIDDEKQQEISQTCSFLSDDSTSSIQNRDEIEDFGNITDYLITGSGEKETELSTSKVAATRGSLNFFTPKLSEMFDRCKITDRNAVYILIAAAEAFERDTKNLIINRTSFQRMRKKFREERHAEIKQQFIHNNCQEFVLHWDGKLLPALTGIEKVDRLAILVTFEGKEQLLGVPEIASSSGEEQALAVFEAIEKWGITDKVQALCCDTTASNTGRINGACINLEKLFISI